MTQIIFQNGESQETFTVDKIKVCEVKNFINKSKFATPSQVLEAVVQYTGIEDISRRTRKREYVEARQMYCLIARKRCLSSLRKIGKEVGYLDHSDVIHAANTMQDLIDTDQRHANHLSNIMKLIYQE